VCRRPNLIVALLVVSALSGAGCGRSDGPDRKPLIGTVTSRDIAGDLQGTIALLPDEKTHGPAANGTIREGHYQFSDDDGPVAGLHRVLIDVEPPHGKMDNPTTTSLQWKFEFEITVPSAAPFEIDFELVRKPSDESTPAP
jgi:hypothetical protein